MEFSEKWGRDVEEAVKLALDDLKLERDEVEVTVLEQPSRGFLGLGAKLAKVRVEKKKPASAEKKPAAERRSEPKAAAKAEKTEEKKAVEKDERKENPEKDERREKPEKSGKKNSRRERKNERITREKPDDLQPVTEHVAIDFLKDVTEKMGLSLNISAEMNEECIYIDIEGKDSGTIIGKRGQTLDAVQYLTSLVVNKNEGKKYMRVVVDAENYRSKREKTLRQLAERLADKVVKTRKSVRLEPMNPYERKVIHATLQSNPNVTTRSEGEEPYRRVIIELK